ncbi:serine/threonine-protein phosphatase 4 regulatory subunit 2-like isoform X1 [Erpetoichthys calabaricus]|uniref:Protein phosphatase 4, regulatory subunit 2a n=1 Tax=Erpetoichthys calabaricus TaxID=27687 RepID=A0A8C4T938_ERPCA|nr:serine/threonine-protein phosphatase 4 regulatory subunit 2-like isoform X1 [Erpetoichthys calabaricus]
MEIDTLLEAVKEFEKKGKKEACPVLDQFLCHVAKSGETMIQWSQFKSYFLFKLEKVMDDFRASAPEQRGPANPNVEYIPYEDMKERILKIVNGYNGIPFTIQRLCELLTDPKKNYAGTDKFLRGVEKNVMVVSCVYPSSEKNGSTNLNRMNGVMFPANSSSYSDRININGPGTPRPVNRTKFSLSVPLTANGLPDSTENKESTVEHEPRVHSELQTGKESDSSNSVKNKHIEEDDTMSDGHEVKRLKFDKDEEDEIADSQSESSSSDSVSVNVTSEIPSFQKTSQCVEQNSSEQDSQDIQTDESNKMENEEAESVNSASLDSTENSSEMDYSEQQYRSNEELNLEVKQTEVHNVVISRSEACCGKKETEETFFAEKVVSPPEMENSSKTTENVQEPVEHN